CSARRLTQVPNEINRNATSLKLLENRIHQISNQSLYNLRNLTFIDLNWNHHTGGIYIANRTFFSLTRLQVLLLDGNLLWKVPEGLPPGLKNLSLNANHIFNITNEDFTGVPNVSEIYLDKNCYYGNPCNIFFSHLTSLNVLSLNYYNLSHVPPNLPNIFSETLFKFE
ncbi:UNVERIFIED_CONTAM: hypothetical protein FKN15_068400, partial [Acipenser sinensis]